MPLAQELTRRTQRLDLLRALHHHRIMESPPWSELGLPLLLLFRGFGSRIPNGSLGGLDIAVDDSLRVGGDG